MSATDDELRMYCVMRTDLVMPVPKMLVQAGHAYMSSGIQAMGLNPDRFWQWFERSQAKIALRAKTLDALLRAQQECEAIAVPCALITDEGRTVFAAPTVTCLGIGPVLRAELPKYVARLQLLKDTDLLTCAPEADGAALP